MLAVFAAVFVSSDTDRTVRLVRPLVEDAVELKELAEGAYSEIRQIGWSGAGDEAVSVYVDALRLPTLLFERLAERLRAVERDMERRQRASLGKGRRPEHAPGRAPAPRGA